MSNKHMKDRCFTLDVIKETQIKLIMDTTIQLLERPNSRTLTTPNTGKDAKQQKLSHSAAENAKCYNHFLQSKKLTSFLQK